MEIKQLDLIKILNDKIDTQHEVITCLADKLDKLSEGYQEEKDFFKTIVGMLVQRLVALEDDKERKTGNPFYGATL